MSFSINVLLPNGRRQNVKVDYNTSILEVLENVCQKADLASEDFDLRHHRKILPTSSTIRFSSLPKNAQLELVQAEKKRVESDVKLCLQLESGERLHDEFHPKTTLWESLEKLAPNALGLTVNPVVIYMRREIVGREALEKTTLRSIGLTGGSSMLRLIDSPEEALRVQANISTPLMRPQPVEAAKEELLINEPAVKTVPAVNSTFVGETDKPESKESKIIDLPVVAAKSEPPLIVTASEEALTISETMQVEILPPEIKTSAVAADNFEKVVLLGARNAVAYNMDLIPPAQNEDMPDSFYDLSVQELQRLAAVSARALNEIINAPLLTSAQRKLDQDGLVLQKLTSYKSSVVRVRFPDHTVLQGCFTAVETIGQVKEFVREYLADTTLDFHLYITPPKLILKEELRLVEAECVPNAVLYFGLIDESRKPEHFMTFDVLGKFSSFATVSRSTKWTEQTEKMVTEPDAVVKQNTELKTVGNPTPSTSHSSARSGNSSKVPKWFKPGK